MNEEILTLPQAAKYCAISRWTLRNFVKSGDLKASHTPGGHWRILKSDLESFIYEKGMYPLDTLLYLEYIRPDDSNAAEILEGKLIVAKDFGKFNVAYNQILKVGINDKGGNENEYALGLNYEFNPRLKVGLESTGNYTEDKYYIGPTISWASEKIWVAIGALRGLNDRSDDLRFRLIVGFPF